MEIYWDDLTEQAKDRLLAQGYMPEDIVLPIYDDTEDELEFETDED